MPGSSLTQSEFEESLGFAGADDQEPTPGHLELVESCEDIGEPWPSCRDQCVSLASTSDIGKQM